MSDDEDSSAYISHLLFLVKNTPAVDVTKLITLQDRSLPEFYEAFKFLQAEQLITVLEGEKLQLTPAGLDRLPRGNNGENVCGYNLFCSQCEGRGYFGRGDLTEKLEEILKSRPSAVEEFDQWYMTGQHATFRSNFMQDRGDLLDKRIVFVGDDDLLSIAVSLTKLPKEVVVLEVDERLINFINKIAKEYDLPLKGYVYDIRLPLSRDFAGHFDVFVCDPTETLEGIKLFLSRGISGLKGVGSAVYFGLTSLEASRKKWAQIQAMVLKMNFALTDIRRNFTEYPDPGWEEKLPIWQSLKTKPTQTWYRSAFYRLEAVDVPAPLISGASEAPDDVYVDNESWATTGMKSDIVEGDADDKSAPAIGKRALEQEARNGKKVKA